MGQRILRLPHYRKQIIIMISVLLFTIWTVHNMVVDFDDFLYDYGPKIIFAFLGAALIIPYLVWRTFTLKNILIFTEGVFIQSLFKKRFFPASAINKLELFEGKPDKNIFKAKSPAFILTDNFDQKHEVILEVKKRRDMIREMLSKLEVGQNTIELTEKVF